MTRDDLYDWNDGFGVWEERPRDPSWLSEETSRTRRGEYERAECCHDAVKFVCEVPRWRPMAGKQVELPSVRMRLCAYHAKTLLASDCGVSAHEIRRPGV